MKKRILSLGLLLLLILSVSANAVGLRGVHTFPSLSFSKNQVNCLLTIYADKSGDKIHATVKLWQGSDCVRLWTTSAAGTLAFSETAPAVKGKTYRLTVGYAVAGKTQPVKSVTKTYR